MSDEELRSFLADHRVVSVATIGPHGRPHLVPLWYAVDGTTFDAPDEAVNTARFGKPSNDQGTGAFPQVRVVALAECGTHAVFAAALAGITTGEQDLFRRLLGKIGAGMLVLADRNFLGHQLWAAAAATGADLLWRARSALIQGLFLGLLGLGVVASTIYRMIVQLPPEAELMGLFGIVALVVNVLAAAVLIPHRTGDANVRAVWLFSRNDAIGNAAVVVAAGLVTWTGTVWPDLVVALVIAGLFLHSSWSIIRDARADLREAR